MFGILFPSPNQLEQSSNRRRWRTELKMLYTDYKQYNHWIAKKRLKNTKFKKHSSLEPLKYQDYQPNCALGTAVLLKHHLLTVELPDFTNENMTPSKI